MQNQALRATLTLRNSFTTHFAGKWLRHPHRAVVARRQKCRDDDELHTRDEQAGLGGAQPAYVSSCGTAKQPVTFVGLADRATNLGITPRKPFDFLAKELLSKTSGEGGIRNGPFSQPVVIARFWTQVPEWQGFSELRSHPVVAGCSPSFGIGLSTVSAQSRGWLPSTLDALSSQLHPLRATKGGAR
jgi:hypothetical protein